MEHAKLSASGAARWMACPPSVRLEESFPDTTSEYAAEGTLAHQLAELSLRYNNQEMSKKAFTTRANKLKAEPLYTQEMGEAVEEYANQVWEIVNETRTACPDALVLFEQRLDFSAYVPEGFGTGDVVLVADDLVNIIDFKYGKGVGVSAEENPQLRLYGLGAYLEHAMLYDIRRIRETIIQPRLENVNSEELTTEELLSWAELVKVRAALAAQGKGEFEPGDHCRFCRAKAICRARAEKNLELTQLDFWDPDLLDDTEIGQVLTQAEMLTAWVKDIKEYALCQAVEYGKHYDGWKLVEGRSNREYTDKEKAARLLTDAGYEESVIYKPQDLLGITDLTKLLGKNKFEAILAEVIHKPEGKPVLVPAADRRPEWSRAEEAKQEFMEGEKDDE